MECAYTFNYSEEEITTFSENTLKQTLSFLILGQRGGQNRVQIIEKLRERPYNLNQLSEQLNLNYRTIRHHIESLLKHELVYTLKEGGYGEVYFISHDLESNMPIFEEVKKKLTTIITSPGLFQSVMEQTNDSIIVIDPSSEVLFWNNASEKLYGYTSEIVGQPLPIFADKTALKKIQALLNDDNTGVSLEIMVKTKSGATVDVNMTFSSITDEQNILIGYSFITADITERKNAHDAIKRQAAELEAVVLSVAESILMLDESGTVVVSNRAAVECLGFMPIGTTYHALITRMGLRVESNLPVKDADSPFVLAQQGRKLIDMPYTIKDIQGGDRSIILSAAPVKTGDIVTGTVVAWHDVTDEKERVRELQESEEKNRVLVENMDVAYAVHKIIENQSGKSMDYLYLEVNDAFERLTGLQRENILNKRVTEIFPGIETMKPNLIEFYGKVAQTGKTQKIETFFEPLKKSYSITAFSTRRGFFTTTFQETDGGKEGAKPKKGKSKQ
jgi:PAS domain S-box-containing protein